MGRGGEGGGEGWPGKPTALVGDNIVAGELSTSLAHETLVALAPNQLDQHLVLEAILQLTGMTGEKGGV